GCVEAAKKLAEMYRDGCANLNVEPNAAEAVRFFRRAWGLGDATAAFELGTLYSLDGDVRDGAAALRWFRKGAEAGCVEAAKKLVEFYRDGNADLNVEPNAAKAERWRRVADGKDGEGGE
ncbi:MAG: sel1 repeat family protein, partial [Thermoguttaceae bacterium]|nr:sel1 repeat family protein [Thermoguttaceae bacterium]